MATKLALTPEPAAPNYAAMTAATIAETQTEAAVAAKLAAAIEEFAGFGRTAGNADGVTTSMAFRFDELRREGVIGPKDAAKLYRPYAEARGADFASSNSYASGLSTFQTFGLPWVTAVHKHLDKSGYDAVRAVRDRVEDKKTVPSLYQSYVKYNRELHTLAERDGINAALAIFAEPDKRDAWIRSWLVAAAAGEETDTLARLFKLVGQVEKWAKREDVLAVGQDILELSKVMGERHAAMVAKRAARRAENAAVFTLEPKASATIN